VLLGVSIALIAEVCGLQPLTFGVGVYLPISTSAPIFVGGLVRTLAMRKTGLTDHEIDSGSGTLYASGLIAGGAIAGVALTTLTGFKVDDEVGAIGPMILRQLAESHLFALAIFAVLAYSLYRYACKK
jgi:uncharacterized oligopeptide transporter (OPT) family protein